MKKENLRNLGPESENVCSNNLPIIGVNSVK